jgi:hypothetical protein
MAETRLGTPLYIAPEVRCGLPQYDSTVRSAWPPQYFSAFKPISVCALQRTAACCKIVQCEVVRCVGQVFLAEPYESAATVEPL